jgi:hypothetical protein
VLPQLLRVKVPVLLVRGVLLHPGLLLGLAVRAQLDCRGRGSGDAAAGVGRMQGIELAEGRVHTMLSSLRISPSSNVGSMKAGREILVERVASCACMCKPRQEWTRAPTHSRTHALKSRHQHTQTHMIVYTTSFTHIQACAHMHTYARAPPRIRTLTHTRTYVARCTQQCKPDGLPHESHFPGSPHPPPQPQAPPSPGQSPRSTPSHPCAGSLQRSGWRQR